MSANACTFQTLLDRAVRLCGLDATRLSPALAADFASWLEARVRDAWIMAQWPETIRVERRAFAPRLDLAVTYPAGARVYDTTTNAYYTCILISLNHPVTNATYWTPAASFDRVLTLEESGEVPMAEILGVWRDDPRKTRSPRRVGYLLLGGEAWCDPPCDSAPGFAEDGATGSTGTRVWVAYRIAPPVFTATPYAAGTAYAIGDAAFVSPNSYRAIAATTGHTPPNATYWLAQTCPAVLADFAARAAKADWLTSDGQEDKAAAQESMARAWLNDRLADLTIHQKQTANYFVT